MTTRKTILFGFLFIVGLACNMAYKAEENTQAKERVTLNIIAFDDKDHVVGDLTSKDFQVMDEGTPQPVAFFRHDEHQAPVVILFDLLNESLGAQGYSTDQIIHALERAESSDSIYFYLLTKEGNVRALRALPKRKDQVDESSGAWTAQIRPLLEAAMNSVLAGRQDYINPIPTTNRVIAALGEGMAAIPDRKYILWVSHGIEQVYRDNGQLRVDYSPKVTQFARALENEGITLNSVDLGNSFSVTSTFEEYANVTGGKVYSKDFEKALSQTIAASHSRYIIQYDAPRSDGKLHKIRVTSTRKGVHLQVKQEYVANP